MNRSEIHVDPARLEMIAEELTMFSGDIKSELDVMKLALNRLQNTWQDDEYKSFVKAIQPLYRILEDFHEEIKRSKPGMLADAELIRKYQTNKNP